MYLKQKEYKFAYYKIVLDKRLTAYKLSMHSGSLL
jgi:hypothetical protein